MSTGNGLALILFGDPKVSYSRTKGRGGTRSTKGATRGDRTPAEPLVDVDKEVKEFEEFLTHCKFVLQSSKNKTHITLHATDISQNGKRPNGQPLLPKVLVTDWEIILSRYRFHIDESDHDKLEQEFHWTLCLLNITEPLDNTKPGHGEGNEYIASVVCFPQSWLSWVDNEWFQNNLQRYWYIQGSDTDTFGIPSAQSTRENKESDCADGRYYFRICNVQNTATTEITHGAMAVDVSAEKLQTGYTDHHKGIYFPQDGLMYVMLVDLPSTYRIARHVIENQRECVMCADEQPKTDLGFVFGKCGHYVCYACCKEYRENLNKVTKCFYCRRATNVNLDDFDDQQPDPKMAKSDSSVIDLTNHHDLTGRDAEMKLIVQRLRLI
jgi:hypothetical protein